MTGSTPSISGGGASGAGKTAPVSSRRRGSLPARSASMASTVSG